jgi:hypothetical protein
MDVVGILFFASDWMYIWLQISIWNSHLKKKEKKNTYRKNNLWHFVALASVFEVSFYCVVKKLKINNELLTFEILNLISFGGGYNW